MKNILNTEEINVPVMGGLTLPGDLVTPDHPRALVIFAHGSGSSRFSSRNRHVAEILNQHGMATLLTDLLTEEEDRVYANRFNIDLLAGRLIEVTRYALRHAELRELNTGYFGASTGAASALKAAAKLPGTIKAIVSRGGRPDLAAETLPEVQAPTLLLVGSLDTDVIQLNVHAQAEMNCENELHVIPGASHLFEEPGKLDEVAKLASAWFVTHLF